MVVATLSGFIHYYYCYYSGGNGLVALWKVPSVQTFFNCVPYHSLLAYKTIYHPGTLRLVRVLYCISYIMLYIRKKVFQHTVLIRVSLH